MKLPKTDKFLLEVRLLQKDRTFYALLGDPSQNTFYSQPSYAKVSLILLEVVTV